MQSLRTTSQNSIANIAIETVSLTYQPVKILVGATWGHRPHNFLAVGAIAPIAPMESAPMVPPNISGIGKATNIKFGTHIQRDSLNKSL